MKTKKDTLDSLKAVESYLDLMRKSGEQPPEYVVKAIQNAKAKVNEL